jgi:uncharacterized protein (TIGR04141 family)
MANAADDGRRLKLSVFLIKPRYADVPDFMSYGGLSTISIQTGRYKGTLAFKGGFRSTPSWVSLFEEVPGFDATKMFNTGTKAIYVIEVDGRWFCFTFGHARHLILEEAIERNFGLLVALNLGAPDAIKAIDKTNISHVALQSREQAGRDVAMDGFEFNTDIDLLKAMTAKGEKIEGKGQETYSGRDSVTINTHVSLDTFPDIARRLFRAFRSTRYKSRYPWFDKITEERDPAIIADLDDALVTGVRAKAFTKIWLAVPEVLDWGDIEGFSFKPAHSGGDARRAGPVVYQDLDIEEWLRAAKIDDELTLDHLRKRRVFLLYKDGRDPTSWRIYRCLNAEIDLRSKKYILNDGDWYDVDRDYVAEVNAFYINLASSTLSLPRFGGNAEPQYLEDFKPEKLGFAYMDRKEVMIGGSRSRVEFCDLFSKANDIVHVKRYGGSSVLSHLFNQAIVSADCFLNEPTFRAAVNKFLPTEYRLQNTNAAPDPSSYTICFAIMSKERGPLELPFFSKVSLRHAVKSLRRMGFKATKLKIER